MVVVCNQRKSVGEKILEHQVWKFVEQVILPDEFGCWEDCYCRAFRK
jgi:hypothetical protein